jgi:drug/metabolite transporter (DMT)-like permease
VTERLNSLSLKWKIAIALSAVYVIWGSTYLAIRFAIETLPPFGMAGVRFVISGLILCGLAWGSGAPRPARVHWRSAAIIGGFLLLGGNGGVVWAEQRVDSGLAALLVATEPLWIVLLLWARPGDAGRQRPGLRVVIGLALGLIGLFLLVRPGSGAIDLVGVVVLSLASLSWAWGSLYGQRAPQPASPILSSGMQMLSGGALLLILSALLGEPGHFEPAQVSLRSLLALGYLVAGGLVAFVSYSWLMRNAPPTLVSTYAYVNPVVAILLGWALAGEPLTAAMLGAAAVIVTGVAVISTAPGPSPKPEAEDLKEERAAA